MSYQRSLMLIEVCPTDSCHWHDYSLTQQKRIVPQLVPIGLRSNTRGTTSVFMISTPLVYQVGFNYDCYFNFHYDSTFNYDSIFNYDSRFGTHQSIQRIQLWFLSAAYPCRLQECLHHLPEPPATGLTGRSHWPKSSFRFSSWWTKVVSIIISHHWRVYWLVYCLVGSLVAWLV